MKRRYAAIVLGLTLTFTSASFAYAAADTAAETADSTAEKAEEAAQEEVYGEVTETGDDSITVNTGTLKEGTKPAEGEKAASIHMILDRKLPVKVYNGAEIKK